MLTGRELARLLFWITGLRGLQRLRDLCPLALQPFLHGRRGEPFHDLSRRLLSCRSPAIGGQCHGGGRCPGLVDHLLHRQTGRLIPGGFLRLRQHRQGECRSQCQSLGRA